MWFQQSLLRYYHLTLIIYYLEEFEQHLDFNNESRQTQYKDWENKNLKNERRVLINHKEIEVTSFDSSDDEVVSPNILNMTTMIPKLDQTKSSFNNRNKSFDNRTGNERSEWWWLKQNLNMEDEIQEPCFTCSPVFPHFRKSWIVLLILAPTVNAGFRPVCPKGEYGAPTA